MNHIDSPRDSERAEIITRWLDRDRRRASDYADNALDLQRLRDSFITELGNREGRATFAAFAAEHLSLGQSPRSKMLTVADNIGDLLRDLPATFQYHAARAVKAGHDLDEVCADALSMPMSDFLEHYELVKPRTATSKRLVCPDCGCVRDADDFEEAPDVDS